MLSWQRNLRRGMIKKLTDKIMCMIGFHDYSEWSRKKLNKNKTIFFDADYYRSRHCWNCGDVEKSEA